MGQGHKLAVNVDKDEQHGWKKEELQGPAFKAKVALEAIRGEATIAELVAKHGVHQTVINTWKRQTLEGMSEIFSDKAEAKAAAFEGEI